MAYYINNLNQKIAYKYIKGKYYWLTKLNVNNNNIKEYIESLNQNP